MSNWSLEVALRVVPPVTPVLHCPVTVQLVVAVMGQVQVRFLDERRLYL